MNHENGEQMETWRKGEFRNILNGHALSSSWSSSVPSWCGRTESRCGWRKRRQRAWLEQGKNISVRNAPSYFRGSGVRDRVRRGSQEDLASVELPSRKSPKLVLLRFLTRWALR